jgi:hypothetical protein
MSRYSVDRPPDFACTAADYARYRAGFPPELLDRLTAIPHERFPQYPLGVPHRVWAVTARAALP